MTRKTTSNLEERGGEKWAKFQEGTELRVLSPPLCFPLASQELVEAVAAGICVCCLMGNTMTIGWAGTEANANVVG